MAHNGGRFQTQPWFLYSGGLWPFINKVKLSTLWEHSSVIGTEKRPPISNLNAYGFPVSVAVGSFQITIQDEGLTYRPGKRVLFWTGNQTFTVSGASLSSGSLSGTNGRAVLTLANSVSPKTITITLTATDGNLTNLVWLHEDDEATYLSQKASFPNREPFGIKFLDTLTSTLNVGSFRFLDAQYSNLSNVVRWADRMPINWFSYNTSYFNPALYAGVLGGGTTAFTATLSGFTLTDGASVQFDIGATTVASGTTTLNVSNTGTKSIKNTDGSAWSKSSGAADIRATASYSAILDSYIIFNQAFDEGFYSGLPPEICIDLCNAVGCHGHFLPPPLACDSPSDYVSSFATYAASNLNSGLKFIIEQGPNECWNPGFAGTSLASLYSTARYSANNVNDWYGRSGALLGAAVSGAFGGDRSRYSILCAVQSVVGPDNPSGSNTSKRVESTRHVSVSGGEPASKYITHMCLANYWTTMKFLAATVGTTADQQLRMVRLIEKAYQWNAGDAATKQTVIDSMFGATDVDNWIASSQGLTGRLDTWSAVAQNYNIFGTSQKFGLTFYEGGFYPGDISLDPTHGIDGVTLSPSPGQPTVITINLINGQRAHGFVAGMAARFRGIGGTTQLNGNTYTVLSVTDTTVTINVDSTGFGAFTSGNSGAYSMLLPPINGIIYDGYGNTGNQTLKLFQIACRASTGTLYAAQKVFAKSMSYPNAELVSQYFLAGIEQWGLYDDLYSTPSPQKDALVLFNNRLRRHGLIAST